jgi:hypothetical protein
MGEVFRARDTKLDRLVAIKVMAPHLVSQNEALLRFQREAKALAKVSHPGIVQAYDTDHDRGQQFLVMEFVEGRSLLQLIYADGRVLPALAADYVYQAALALHHAHERGLIHRNVKPGNLLLAERRRIKILDLGLAHFAQDQLGDAGLTREGVGMGTPDYMAPEQFTNARLADARCDVYSLGCTLYHLLTGRVPFPGTSLSEKAAAHEYLEPTGIEEASADAPVGLALAARRMMAKRPADRFQSMLEVSEALTPHVAGSSLAVPHIQATSSWQGSQLSFQINRPASRPRRWVRPAIVSGVLAGLLLILGAVFLPNPWRTEELDVPNVLGGNEAAKTDQALSVDPNVLTVSKDAKDGGQFQSIGAALEQVKPGQTIRVLDKGEYKESLSLGRRGGHLGITLEAAREAIVKPGRAGESILNLHEADGVTVRGFRLSAGTGEHHLITVTGRSPGVTLEDLVLELSGEGRSAGVWVDVLSLQATDAPLVIQRCHFQRGVAGIAIRGTPAVSSSRLRILRNRFQNQKFGFISSGGLRELQLAGNSFEGARSGAISLDALTHDTQALLIANNTIDNCGGAIGLSDQAAQPRDVLVANNLILGSSGADIMMFASMGTGAEPPRAGDGMALAKAWRFINNWRETFAPPAGHPLAKGWVPPGPTNLRVDRIEGIIREAHPMNSVRPAKDSPLATEGAGKSDPRLPSYVGAVPPEGTQPWEWDRTWRMPKEVQLLTVSKEEKDGGRYRTINEALQAAKPWATVRVLDAATYRETIALDDPTKHAGIAFEALKRATIEMTHESNRAISLKAVPDVVIQGFRLQADNGVTTGTLVLVESDGPGVILDDLQLKAANRVSGIGLRGVGYAPGARPLVVRNCRMNGVYNGLELAGHNARCSAVIATGNHFFGLGGSGVFARGKVGALLFAGNIVAKPYLGGAEFADLPANEDPIIIANNTLFGGDSGVRFVDMEPFEEIRQGHVQLFSNLISEAHGGNISYLVPRGGTGQASPEFTEMVRARWLFKCNWRDLSGSDLVVPLGKHDRRLEKNYLSQDVDAPDHLRPPHRLAANHRRRRQGRRLPALVCRRDAARRDARLGLGQDLAVADEEASPR